MSITFYKGDKLDKLDNKLKIDPYIPSEKLVEAVNLALILGRPLLVKGEPGCGKSKLAEAVAAELHDEKFRDYYFEWNVKSTSKAQDGLYVIDHLQRLSDANINRDNKDKLEISLPSSKDGQYETKGNYIELGVLGKAFMLTNKEDTTIPPVILIDEIDKADIDFPNDLLLELDRMEFKIPEVKDKKNDPIVIKANQHMKPLFIITSNDEKPLPAAFLRRCLFYYIDFTEIKLNTIVKTRYPDLPGEIVGEAVDKFKAWRDTIEKNGTGNKNISTSELIDWIKIINYYTLVENKKTELEESGQPAYAQALLKDVESIKLFNKKDS